MHSTAEEIEKRAIEEGMISMKQDGYLKSLEGITSLEEVLRVAQD
jgi:type II secretory ATPase GspE/PulE/Tfp pilus assembly ATPase PilB-like protein